MAGIWFKRCPQCGTYLVKNEPQEAAVCRSCGWEEHPHLFYCAEIDGYCVHPVDGPRRSEDEIPGRLLHRHRQ